MWQLFKWLCSLLLLAGGYLLAGENLAPFGGFESPADSLKPFVGSTFPKMSIVMEEPGRNHCVKVEIASIDQRSDGEQGVHANVIFKLALKPNTNYHFSFDLKGTAPRFLVELREKEGRKLPFTLNPAPPLKSSYYEVTADWKEYNGSFRTDDCGDVQLFVTLWHNTFYGKMFYAVGDYFLLDNLMVK